jgi:hypothetical protein
MSLRVRTGSFTEVEQRAMMDSLRSATRNTGFERWLDAAIPPSRGSGGLITAAEAAAAQENPAGTLPAPGGPGEDPARHRQQQGRGGGAGASGGLADVAAYLAGGTAPDGQAAGGAAGVFRPGWEDIFRMNQKQLEVRGLLGFRD